LFACCTCKYWHSLGLEHVLAFTPGSATQKNEFVLVVGHPVMLGLRLYGKLSALLT
jgi:hypothetical protein